MAFKNILASLTGSPSDETVLKTASDVAMQCLAHVECLHVAFEIGDIDTATYALYLQSTGAIEQIRAVERRTADNAAAARGAFDEICSVRNLTISESTSAVGKGASFAYRKRVGSDLDVTVEEARTHDLTVIARDSRNVIVEPDRAGTVMLGAGRPILVPSRKATKTIGTKVVIAWKNSAESARACAAAMPFVMKADSVTVIAAVEASRPESSEQPVQSLVRELAWHGVKAKSKLLPFSLKPTAETILDEAYHLETDLLIMGGYGHSRFREIVFGGVTREILAECEIPVLMSH